MSPSSTDFVLTRLPSDQLDRAVDAIGSTLATANALTNLSATSSLLALVFPDGKAPAEARALSRAQRRAVELITEHGAFTVGEGIFGNYGLTLGNWRLPFDRDKLRAWLAGG